MRKKLRILCGISSLLLIAVMLFSMFCIAPLTSSAASVTKIEKSYDIAIAFDNSGSMYHGGDEKNGSSKAWCRAKYAMEIFASMLNYGKDKLHIFPMWGVTTDGSQPMNDKNAGSYDPIAIASKNDIEKINKIFSCWPSKTAFAPVTEAHQYLQQSTADEKWLIVLSDGEFNQEARGQDAKIDLAQRLPALASSDIKVQYLGFGEATKLQEDIQNNFYAKSSSETSLMSDLVDICNRIFQRSELPKKYISGTTVKIDVSMKNVIVFAQGANAKINSLTDSSGKKIDVTMDSGQRKYSTIHNGRYNKAKPDTTLAGQVVSFAACPKGEYTLSYSGNIQIFYEPDVDMEIEFVNSDGERITSEKEFTAGEYNVTSKIVDSVTGKDVTNHELMGKNTKITTFVKTSKDSKAKEYANGSKIVFGPDTKTEVWVEGKYLGKYTISSKDDKKWDWINPINIAEPSSKIKVDIVAEQDWFQPQKHDEWKPLRVNLTMEGKPLDEKQFNSTELLVQVDKDLSYRLEPLPGESAYNIYISQDKNGKYVEPNTGKYKLTAKAAYDDGFVSEVSKPDKVSFEIQTYTLLQRWLSIIGIILLILIILAIISWLLHKIKVFPNDVAPENSIFKKDGKNAGVAVASLTASKGSLFKKTGTINVRASKGNMGIALQVEAVSTLFKFPFRYQKPSRRRYRVTGISASGMDYVKVEGEKFTKDTYSEASISCSNQTSVEFEKRVNGIKSYVKTDIISK